MNSKLIDDYGFQYVTPTYFQKIPVSGFRLVREEWPYFGQRQVTVGDSGLTVLSHQSRSSSSDNGGQEVSSLRNVSD